MKKILIVGFALLFFGCKTPKLPTQVPIRIVEKEVERLVPYALPADSSTLEALFECDSLNNVVLKELTEVKAKNWQSYFHFSAGLFRYNLSKPPDTVYIPATDRYIEREVPVYIEVPVKVNELTPFQAVCVWIGKAIMGILGIGLVSIVIYTIWKLKR